MTLLIVDNSWKGIMSLWIAKGSHPNLAIVDKEMASPLVLLFPVQSFKSIPNCWKTIQS